MRKCKARRGIFLPIRQAKIRQLAKLKSANSQIKNPPTRQVKIRQLAKLL